MTTASFETEVGNINIEFFSDDAPNTVKSSNGKWSKN